MVRASAGDARAFRQIFERYAPAVRRFLMDVLGDAAAADEATQETFVRAHGRLSTIRDTDKLLSWLFGIARNVFLEHIRARRLDRARALPHWAGSLTGDQADAFEPVDSAPTPEVALLHREADAMLDRALKDLSEQRRAALLLRLDHGLGYEDVAEIMGWPVAKVKNEIHRARLQLRTQLNQYIGGRP